MKFGPVPTNVLPYQDSRKVLITAERWQRASFAHEKWATPAKEAVDFFEGRQYTDLQLAEMRRMRRPALKFNIIAPIVRLVIGYHRNNKTDIQFAPANDSLASEDVADTLSRMEKSVATDNMLEFVDPEVFLDGLISARGWFDTRLDWENNDLGSIKVSSLDPFCVKVDPDCDTYDINESASFVLVDKMVSVDEIEAHFGRVVAALVRPWTMGQTPLAPVTSLVLNNEVTPVRYFGNREDGVPEYWDDFYNMMGDFVDVHRKTIRLIEQQYKVRELRNVFIDLETGDKKVLPKDWGRDRIEKALLYAEYVDNACTVEQRMVERMHWQTTCGDLILYDRESFYDTYTMTGYFPYFRRGVTRGMVEDLIDPQKEKNKSRSNRVEIESKTANGGWLYHEKSLDPVQQARLQKLGSTPGVNIKWKGEVTGKPEPIKATPAAMSYERLEQNADEDIRRISGVNESALGDTDISNQSGRAIEARQRQAVISVQMYMDNFRRSKHLRGKLDLAVFQNYYTERRIFRVLGEDGNRDPFAINELINDPVSGAKRILNDITLGKYTVVVDERPLNPTFEAAQFEEAMGILEKLAPALGNFLPMFADLLIGMSSLPRKQEWIERFQALMGQVQAQQDATAMGGPAPSGGPQPSPGRQQKQLPAPPRQSPMAPPAG